jgi:hypothetical protein
LVTYKNYFTLLTELECHLGVGILSIYIYLKARYNLHFLVLVFIFNKFIFLFMRDNKINTSFFVINKCLHFIVKGAVIKHQTYRLSIIGKHINSTHSTKTEILIKTEQKQK